MADKTERDWRASVAKKFFDDFGLGKPLSRMEFYKWMIEAKLVDDPGEVQRRSPHWHKLVNDVNAERGKLNTLTTSEAWGEENTTFEIRWISRNNHYIAIGVVNDIQMVNDDHQRRMKSFTDNANAKTRRLVAASKTQDLLPQEEMLVTLIEAMTEFRTDKINTLVKELMNESKHMNRMIGIAEKLVGQGLSLQQIENEIATIDNSIVKH